MFDKNRIGVLTPNDFQIMPKPWGWERVLWNNEDYCCKELFFFKGKTCSWHYHNEKDELFRILSGTLYIQYSFGDCMCSEEFAKHIISNEPDKRLNQSMLNWEVLNPGDVFHVPRGLRHRMTGQTDCLMLEVSTFHKEEDSIRLIKSV